MAMIAPSWASTRPWRSCGANSRLVFSRVRTRDHGIIIGEGTPGPENAITDVAGVLVGHTTLVEGSGALDVGRGPVRTGVTVVLPPGDVWTLPFSTTSTASTCGQSICTRRSRVPRAGRWRSEPSAAGPG